ncbi:hypothetical protein C0J52_21970 [Blattella germanica]|nr:hypothetical protein C0J52_21970 [Blattella germanica]
MSKVVADAANWCNTNKFFLNLDKNKKKKNNFSLKRDIYNDDNSVKLLCFYIDAKLIWNDHILYVSGRLSKVIYILRQLRSCQHKSYLKWVYHSLFHSILSYGLLLWGNSTGVENIVLLQKKPYVL